MFNNSTIVWRHSYRHWVHTAQVGMGRVPTSLLKRVRMHFFLCRYWSATFNLVQPWPQRGNDETASKHAYQCVDTEAKVMRAMCLAAPGGWKVIWTKQKGEDASGSPSHSQQSRSSVLLSVHVCFVLDAFHPQNYSYGFCVMNNHQNACRMWSLLEST